MTLSIEHGNAREELLSLARNRSPGTELRCHALLELMGTSKSLGLALRSELAHHELTENGFHALAYIIHHESNPVTPGDIASEFNVPRQTVSAILGRLEVSGLISRRRIPENRRSIMLQATDRGRKIFLGGLKHCLESINKYMSALPAEDITRLENSCVRLRQFSEQTVH